jgi:hypothetical protein
LELPSKGFPFFYKKGAPRNYARLFMAHQMLKAKLGQQHQRFKVLLQVRAF